MCLVKRAPPVNQPSRVAGEGRTQDTGRVRPAVVVLAALAVLALGYLAHRGLTAMERRGWIYYRTRSRGAMGAAAMFGLTEVFQPAAHSATVEQQAADRRGPRRQAPGDPPTPDGHPPTQDGALTQPDEE